MTRKDDGLYTTLLTNIDAIYPPVSQQSVRLTKAQRDEVDRLRAEIRTLCDAGKDDEARRVAEKRNRENERERQRQRRRA